MVLILFKKEGFIIFSIYLLDTSQLFQWDLNRKIKIFGKRNIDEVHFCHAGDEEALIVPVKQENNILIANIPNILLQDSADIWYYLVAEGKTLKEGFFSVNNREKPSEYIYEETEILNYAALEKRLQKIEEDLKNFKSEETDPTIPDWAKQPEKPKYTAGEVGAAAVDEVIGLINFHNTAGNSHNDLRVRMDNFTSSLNNKANKNEIPQIYDWAKQPNKPTYTAEETGAISSAAFNELSSSVSVLANSQVGKKIENGGEIFNDYANNIASGIHSHAEGQNNKARGRFSHAEGLDTEAKADVAHTEGEATISYTVGSHAEGKFTQAGGNGTNTGGSYAHAEGVGTIALARGSHAEGENTLAQAQYSHAEGGSCRATGDYSHAEGCNNGDTRVTASGKGAHAEGWGTTSSGQAAHTEGIGAVARGTGSHAEGGNTIATAAYQHVQGKYNIEDTANKYAHIVGNGESNSSRSNAHTLDWSGNAEFQGDVKANAFGSNSPISLVETANALVNKITTPLTAEVGQILEVEEVDENGVPTKWKAVDKPTSENVDLSEYVKNTDYATKDKGGTVRAYSTGDTSVPGVGLSGNGILGIVAATNAQIDSKTTKNPIVPTNLDYAIKSSLITNSLEWTKEEKQVARDLIGASDSGVEITDGEPMKDTTVLTLNPNAEKVNLYTAEEIDEMLQNLPGGSGGDGKAIITVDQLPTERINNETFYRVLIGKFIFNGTVFDIFNYTCVNELPEVGTPFTDAEMSIVNAYYVIRDEVFYGYVDEILSSALGMTTGWYEISTLLNSVGIPYGGIITSLEDATNNDLFYLLLEKELYQYDGSWKSLKSIGWSGTGNGSEIFNKYNNEASGWYSHAEGYDTHAQGGFSHSEGYETIASGDCSHAEGDCSHAEGQSSHAEGGYTVASSDYSHAQGKYNIEDTEKKYAHIVGNGLADINRSNAHTLDWQGNAEFQGDVIAQGCGGESPISLKALAENTYTKTQIDAMFGSYVTDIAFLIGGDA